MKLKRNYSKKLIKIALLKSKIYSSYFLEDGMFQSLNLEKALKTFRTIFSVIRSFHLKRKTILFLGFPENLERFVNSKTQHIALSAAERLHSLHKRPSNPVYSSFYNTAKLVKVSLVVCYNEKNQIHRRFFVNTERAKVPLIYIGFDSEKFFSQICLYTLCFYSDKNMKSLYFLNNICFMSLTKILSITPPKPQVYPRFRKNKKYRKRYNKKKKFYHKKKN